jgi:integrase
VPGPEQGKSELEKTHQVNLRVARHLKNAFASRKLVDITADDIEIYLSDRLRKTVRVRTALGYRQMGVLKPTTVHQELRVLRRMLNVAVRKKLLQANPCWGVEFPVAVRGLFRPHFVTWSEQRRIESHAPGHLRNIVQIITETGLRVYKELTPMRKDQVDLAGVPYFRIYDLRSTYATRLSAGGVADEWVTQLLRQGDAKVFKKYSQMKLQMKREALEKMNRQANEMPLDSGTATIQ